MSNVEMYNGDLNKLKPLESYVPIGTKCAVLADTSEVFGVGEIVMTLENNSLPLCVNSNGKQGLLRLRELALLPTENESPATQSAAESPTNHDPHYRAVEARLGVEPMRVMESIICNGLPSEHHATAIRNLSVALAVKYSLRLGEKDDPAKELDKMANYIHRAQTGEWRS